MTAVSTFPMTQEMRARLAARESALAMSRTILRGKGRHAADDLRLACHTLMTYGDHWDWVEAYQVLRALDAPPAASQRRGKIRDGLRDMAVLLGFGAVVLVVVYVGGGAL